MGIIIIIFTMKFAAIAILASAQATSIREPWIKDSLPDCPEDPARTVMDDGETHVTKYPFVGATCQLQIGDVNMVMLGGEPGTKPAPGPPTKAPPVPKIPDLSGLEHCPDFNERFTLVNGRTRAIAYPIMVLTVILNILLCKNHGLKMLNQLMFQLQKLLKPQLDLNIAQIDQKDKL